MKRIPKQVREYMASLGRKTSPAKTAAVRKNGALGAAIRWAGHKKKGKA